MPEPAHTIRLRGPWNLELRRDGTKIAGAKVNIRPEDQRWSDSLHRSIEKFDRNALDSPESKSIELELNRFFKWPNAVPARMELCVEAGSPFRVTLNELALVAISTSKEQVSRFDILPAIQDRNRLAFYVEDLKFEQVPEQLSGAWIEIWED